MKYIDYLAEELKLEQYRQECAANNVEPVIDYLADELTSEEPMVMGAAAGR